VSGKPTVKKARAHERLLHCIFRFSTRRECSVALLEPIVRSHYGIKQWVQLFKCHVLIIKSDENTNVWTSKDFSST
jgi:hypothetical protein